MKHFSVSINNEASDMISDLYFSTDSWYDITPEIKQKMIQQWVIKSLNILKSVCRDIIRDELSLYNVCKLIDGYDVEFSMGGKSYRITTENALPAVYRKFGLYEFEQVVELTEETEDEPF